jgi:hypothetical protein
MDRSALGRQEKLLRNTKSCIGQAMRVVPRITDHGPPET